MDDKQFISSPRIHQELLGSIISLKNEIKLLKEENQKQQKEINYLKENAIIREKLDTLYSKRFKI